MNLRDKQLDAEITTRSFDGKLKTRRWLNWIFITTLVGCIGAGLALVWMNPDSTTWSSLPFPTLGTISAACIAALGALAVAQTYGEKKSAEIGQRHWELRQALRTQRERTYAALAYEHLAIFRGGSAGDLAKVRADAALWASPDVISALAAWNRLLTEMPETSPHSGQHTVTQEL